MEIGHLVRRTVRVPDRCGAEPGDGHGRAPGGFPSGNPRPHRVVLAGRYVRHCDAPDPTGREVQGKRRERAGREDVHTRPRQRDDGIKTPHGTACQT